MLRKVKPVDVDIRVHDGEVMDWCGGCEIVATAVHTPGHISLFLSNRKTVIAGDAAALKNNKLIVANPQFTLDMVKAKKDIIKILGYDADRFICYHGGVYIRK